MSKKAEIVGLDFDSKVKMLEGIAEDLLDMQLEIASVSGKYAELHARLRVLKEVKSALQSAIRAEMSM